MTPSQSTALLPCPFCGGAACATGVVRYDAKHEAWFSDGTRVLEAFFCNCMSCGIDNKGLLGHQTREKAIAAWNRRAPAAATLRGMEKEGPSPVAWRVRGYSQFKTGTPRPWRYFDGAERPKVNSPSDCDFEPLYAQATPHTYEQRLRAVLQAVQEYLPPGGISAEAALSRVIEQVDPWPATPHTGHSAPKPAAYRYGTALLWPDDAPVGDPDCTPLYEAASVQGMEAQSESLTPDELDELISVIESLGHDKRSFEAECPACTAVLKLKAMRDAAAAAPAQSTPTKEKENGK